MTSHHPIDVEKLLEEQLAAASPELLRTVLSTFIAALMSAEVEPTAYVETSSRS
jgi:putative transposase